LLPCYASSSGAVTSNCASFTKVEMYIKNFNNNIMQHLKHIYKIQCTATVKCPGTEKLFQTIYGFHRIDRQVSPHRFHRPGWWPSPHSTRRQQLRVSTIYNGTVYKYLHVYKILKTVIVKCNNIHKR